MPASAEAAIRYQRAGAATLGGPDALAGVREACELVPRHVWVEVEGRGECIAYYPTAHVEGSDRAVLYFEGDIPPPYRNNPPKLGGHLAKLRGALARLSRTLEIPYILVARPGTFGSTGSHAERRETRQYLVMHAAVDAIRRRHAIRDMALAGQSGGATVVAALLTLGLPNVRCAVPASGAFDLTAMLDWHADRYGLVAGHREHPASIADSFNVMDRIGNVRADPQRRVFVIGDERDRVTPFAQQRRFAERLKADGHHAEIVAANGHGPERHGLAAASLRAAGLCVTGVSDAEIRKAVGR